MPTRYTLDVDLKSLVTADVVENNTKRIETRKVRGLGISYQLTCLMHQLPHPGGQSRVLHHCKPVSFTMLLGLFKVFGSAI